MQTNTFASSVLRLMFVEARKSAPPSRKRLAALLGASQTSIDQALAELEQRGFADARRGRLTLVGLAVAAATQSAESRRPASLAGVIAA